MTDQNLTHLYFLLDRSGSMHSIADDVAGGFDAFMAEQRAAQGQCRVTLAQFDDDYTEVYRDRPVDQVPPLELMPRGRTALLDSIGRLVTEAGRGIAALPEDERPGTVVVGIMTDGMENASHEYTHSAVKALIEQQTRDHDWQFLFMGADQDAIEVGASIGVARANAVTYGRGKARDVMAATAGNIGRYRAAKLAGVDEAAAAALVGYTETQRSQVVD